MSTSRSMTTITTVLTRLQEKGYGDEIRIGARGAQIGENGRLYQPSELTILKVYRFEGESDPGDMSVIYAVRAADGRQGFLLNAYGTYSDQDNPYYDEFIKCVPIKEQEDV